MVIKQYDIYWCNLNPTKGAEMSKIRPCLVISPEEMNKHIKTVMIAPITSAIREYPTRVRVELEGKKGTIALDQIRTIDKTRFEKYIDTLSKKQIQEVKAKIKEMLVD